MSDPLFLGIDLGTTRVKVGAYGMQGDELSHAVLELPSADSWWTLSLRAIRMCVQKLDPSSVRALCVGGQGPTLVAVDAHGRLVREPILYNDPRAASEADRVSNLLGRSVSVRSSYLPRALWMQVHEADQYAATRWFLQAWDYLIYALSGTAVATSPSGAYTPWQVPEIAQAGLNPEQFPHLVQTGEVAAVVSNAAASQTGLPAGTPIVAGGGDFLLGTMGVAGAQKGVAQSQGGASSAFTLCWHTPLRGDQIGWCIPSPVEPALYNAGGPVTTGGAALDWLLREVLASSASYEIALESVSHIPPGAGGLVFFPYLAGEALTLGPEVRGAFIGLSLHHRSQHLIRAVLEGVALAGKYILESLVGSGGHAEQVIVCGGQARSTVWNQIKASVWGLPVVTSRVHDVGCLGAAAVAASGLGFYQSLSAASRGMAQVGDCYAPDPEQAEVYDKAFSVFRQILPRNDGLFKDLHSLRKDTEE